MSQNDPNDNDMPDDMNEWVNKHFKRMQEMMSGGGNPLMDEAKENADAREARKNKLQTGRPDRDKPITAADVNMVLVNLAGAEDVNDFIKRM